MKDRTVLLKMNEKQDQEPNSSNSKTQVTDDIDMKGREDLKRFKKRKLRTTSELLEDEQAAQVEDEEERLDQASSPSGTTAASLTSQQRKEKIAAAVSTILEALGEDGSRDGLRKTPTRYADALMSFTQGYETTPATVFGDAEFDENHHEVVMLRDIEFFSLCEHHMVPFFGKVHIAYLPSGKVVGLSKLAKVVDMFAQRLQVQERLTTQISRAIWDELEPRGVAVYIEAQHLCMMMRGVKKSGAKTITTSMLGVFKDDFTVRSEFLEMTRRS
eukprot:CAMPEP_0182441270 /NCGR_PEP_ID=MMETSP1172-20130603/212_1 /TAXON_ID=708627 /ORGANISM="Timspurckia oligopyrenoides, Strain CCMP3278" /LENGTH=272 /DNA_ID=CAMNT_0024635451 /DNA_START=87 /DNA_END=905 /DNA_ORIENTATION=-